MIILRRQGVIDEVKYAQADPALAARAPDTEDISLWLYEIRQINEMALRVNFLYEEFVLFGIYPNGGEAYQKVRSVMSRSADARSISMGLEPLDANWSLSLHNQGAQMKNLINIDSLTDIVSNSVGILIIFAVINLIHDNNKTYELEIPIEHRNRPPAAYIISKDDRLLILNTEQVFINAAQEAGKGAANNKRIFDLGYQGLFAQIDDEKGFHFMHVARMTGQNLLSCKKRAVSYKNNYRRLTLNSTLRTFSFMTKRTLAALRAVDLRVLEKHVNICRDAKLSLVGSL